MWKQFLNLSENGNEVIAKLPTKYSVEDGVTKQGISEALDALGAGNFYIDNDAVERFVNLANEGKKDAFQGFSIALKRNADVFVEIIENDMIANMVVVGAYGGRGLRGSEIIHALAKAQVVKGIDKVALKKVLAMSITLAPGERFTQLVARGKDAVNGHDTRFKPLVEDYTHRILAPQQKENSEKLDMKNLGETITVGIGDHLMKREPATKGSPGFTVQGKILQAKPGKDALLKAGKGSEISKHDPNILIASMAGLPVLKASTVDVESAMCLKDIGVSTGHIKFKGCLVVTGNIEPGMIVRATGTITVGGFIESADVQAQEDILVAKGIIGHTVHDEEARTCIVKSGRSIKANYAQYSEIQAHDDITLEKHSLSNIMRCGNNLRVLDEKEKHGTLSGGVTKVGGKVICYNLGVEGDTLTNVECFARFESYKEKVNQLKEGYKKAQDDAMNAIRNELNTKKKPKSERVESETEDAEQLKELTNAAMLAAKQELENASNELESLLVMNTVEVKNHVYTHVIVRFGEEKVSVKREHGPSVFSFNQREIHCSSMLDSDDLATAENNDEVSEI